MIQYAKKYYAFVMKLSLMTLVVVTGVGLVSCGQKVPLTSGPDRVEDTKQY